MTPVRATLLALIVVSLPVAAQTPAQMEYERQQREYWRQQEQQRQEQQRQQQIMNENARRQQEESRRLNTPMGTSPTPGLPAGSTAGGAQYQGGAQAAAIEAARQDWLKRPPLAADRNPLIGKWTRPASTRPKSSDPFAHLGALIQGGLCEALFGGGVFEFRADRLVGFDERTREQELDRVEYRGDSKRVAVLPRTTLRLIVFDIEGSDRINWAGQDCVLVRAGAASTAAAPAAVVASRASPTAMAAAAPTPVNAGVTTNAGAVLNLVAGFATDGGAFSPLAGSKFIVLRHSVDVALASRGFRSPPGVSVYQGWVAACQTGASGCAQGLQGIQADALGVLTTDAQGNAQTPPLAAGTYYVFGSAKRGAQPMMWNQRVALKPGSNSVQLDQRNAAALN